MTRTVSTRTALVAVLLGALGVLGLGAAAPAAPAAALSAVASPLSAGETVGPLASGPGEHRADVRVDASVVVQAAGALRQVDRVSPGGAAVLPAVLGATLLVLALLGARRRDGSAVRRPGGRVASRAPPQLIAC